MTNLYFAFNATESRNTTSGGGEAINCFKEQVDKKAYSLTARPGYVQRATISGLACRGFAVVGDYLYTVHGQAIYKTTKSLISTFIGNITTTGGRVYLRSNGFSIGIVDGENFYDLNLTTDILTTRTLPAGVSPSHIAYTQGFFIINDVDTGDIYHHEDSFDTSTWNSLDQSNAEYAPDNVLGLFDVSGNILIPGENTLEVWVYTGNINFVIGPVQGLTYSFGLAAKHSFTKMTDAGFFLARDASGGLQAIMISRGTDVKPVGDQDVISEWTTYAKVSDAVSTSTNISGHPVWLLSFPSEDVTWVFDDSIKFGSKWSKWQRYDDYFASRGRFLAENTFHFAGKQYMTSYDDGGLYELSVDIYSDDGDPLIITADSQEILSNSVYQSHADVDLFMETGHGLSNQNLQGHDPKVRLGYSDDHGRNWTWREWTSFGKPGEYDKQVKFRSLGRSRHRKYRVQISDPVKSAILNPSRLRLGHEA